MHIAYVHYKRLGTKGCIVLHLNAVIRSRRSDTERSPTHPHPPVSEKNKATKPHVIHLAPCAFVDATEEMADF